MGPPSQPTSGDPYGQQPGYPPQQPGYPPPGQPGQQPGQQPGYPPQQPGYPPQQPGYPPTSPYPPVSPGGYPGAPGAAGPPGYGPPPGYPPPGMPGGQPPQKRTGLLIAAVAGAAVLVLLLAGVGGALILRSGDDDDGGSGNQPPAAIDQPTQPATVPTGEPDVDLPTAPPDNNSGGGGSGAYGFVDGLCDELNVDPAYDILPTEHQDRFVLENESNFGSSTSCSFYLTDDSSFGTLSVDVSTSEDPENAQSSHEIGLEFAEEDADGQSVDGPWAEGVIFYGAPIPDAAAELFVLDGNLDARVRFSLSGDAAEDNDMGEAVVPIMIDALELSSQ